MSAMSQDVCVMGMSGGLQYPGIGLSLGAHIKDENCDGIKLSKVLNDLGMKVVAVSVLCQDPRVFFAMNNLVHLVRLKVRLAEHYTMEEIRQVKT